jgi:hypothetical protein
MDRVTTGLFQTLVPPDLQEEAVKTVLMLAEFLCAESA